VDGRRFSYGVTNYRQRARRETLAAVLQTRRNVYIAAAPRECAELYTAVSACEKIPGAMAEAGVYRGGTAAVMLSAPPAKRLHRFDTFARSPHPPDCRTPKANFAPVNAVAQLKMSAASSPMGKAASNSPQASFQPARRT
jgi:hypothetical protein